MGVRLTELSAGADATAIVVARADADEDLAAWLAAHKDDVVTEALARRGAVLFANFAVRSIEDFDRCVQDFGGEKLSYGNRLSPRHEVGANIFTASERDARFRFPYHNENAKDLHPPRQIWFFCMQPSLRGGETTLCDGRQVLRRLRPATVERFVDKQVCYVLRLENGSIEASVADAREKLSFGWQFYFNTTDRSVAEERCAEEGATFQWEDDGALTMSMVRPAVVPHPVTGERVWFNHVCVFASTKKLALDPQRKERSDRYVLFGDRAPIPQDVIDEIDRAYRDVELCLPWQEGNIMLVDNYTVAHGRNPFSGGERKIYVAMTR